VVGEAAVSVGVVEGDELCAYVGARVGPWTSTGGGSEGAADGETRTHETRGHTRSPALRHHCPWPVWFASGGEQGDTPSSLQRQYRAGGRVHTPCRVAPPAGRHQLNTARQLHFTV